MSADRQPLRGSRAMRALPRGTNGYHEEAELNDPSRVSLRNTARVPQPVREVNHKC